MPVSHAAVRALVLSNSLEKRTNPTSGSPKKLTAAGVQQTQGSDIPLIGRIGRKMMAFINGARYSIHITGKEKVPTGAVVFTSNHPAFLETTLLDFLPGRPRAIATDAFGQKPDPVSQLIHMVIKASGSILTSGGNVAYECAKQLEKGESIWLAPMGRNHPNEPLTTLPGCEVPPPKGQEGPKNIFNVSVEKIDDSGESLGLVYRPLPKEVKHNSYSLGISSGAVVMSLLAKKPIVPVYFSGIKAASKVAMNPLASAHVGIKIGDPILIDSSDADAAYKAKIAGEPIPKEIIEKYKELIVNAVNSLGNAAEDDLPYKIENE